MRLFSPAALTAALMAFGLVATACHSRETPMPETAASLTLEDVMGYWALTGPDGADCRVALQPTPAGEDYGVLVEACAVEAILGAARWRLDGDGFEVLASDGAVLARFTSKGPDAYDGRGPDGATYALERAAVV